MTVEIQIPTPLRKYTDNNESVEVDGETVGEALAELGEHHPKLREQIFSDDGSLRRFVNVFANEDDIRFKDELATSIEDGDEISIIPAIAGG